MRRSLAAATVAASIAVGGLGGAVLGAPGLAGAADTATATVSWVEEALSGLVEDGTIDQAQADAVEAALAEARPARPLHHRFHVASEALTEVLGITAEELRAAFEDGKTIAQIAEAEGVPVQDVVDALVAEHETHLDERVAEGDLTRAEADEILEDAEERVTAMVNGEAPAFGGRGGRHHRGFGGFGPGAMAPDEQGTTSTTA